MLLLVLVEWKMLYDKFNSCSRLHEVLCSNNKYSSSSSSRTTVFFFREFASFISNIYSFYHHHKHNHHCYYYNSVLTSDLRYHQTKVLIYCSVSCFQFCELPLGTYIEFNFNLYWWCLIYISTEPSADYFIISATSESHTHIHIVKKNIVIIVHSWLYTIVMAGNFCFCCCRHLSIVFSQTHFV